MIKKLCGMYITNPEGEKCNATTESMVNNSRCFRCCAEQLTERKHLNYHKNCSFHVCLCASVE